MGVPTLWRGGCTPHTFLPNFQTNCRKLKVFGCPGAGGVPRAPFDPPLTDMKENVSPNRKFFIHYYQWRIQDFQGLRQSERDANLLLLPANVVCEGYVFTPVCDSVNGGGQCAWLLRGVCVVAPGGRAWLLRDGGMRGIQQDTEIRSMSGRYASYWNAFLFNKIFAENYIKMKEFGPVDRKASTGSATEPR